MGDCLSVFSSDFGGDAELEELAECNVRAFCDLSFFHCSIQCYLGADGYPTLMRLLDSDGRFPASEVRALEREIQQIAAAFRDLPSGRVTIAFERVQEARAAEARAAKARAAEKRAAEESTAVSSLCRCAQKVIIDPLGNRTSFQYSVDDIAPTGRKLREIAAEFHELQSDGSRDRQSRAPGGPVAGGPLYDCFRNANGENLFECLLKLCAIAIERGRPIISE
jgi:hypothetical protein